MKYFTDQMGRSIALSVFPPRRIVSLVPSQTELLSDLGLEAAVVGITKFCVHPPAWFQHKKRVGGTKTVNLQKVADLAPDLIIGNKEENEQEQIDALSAQFPVWMSDIRTLSEACAMIRETGALTGSAATATEIADEIERRFANNRPHAGARQPKVAYLIWRKPYMVAAGETFIDAMLVQAGFVNAFGHKNRYPEILPEDLIAAQPDVLLLSSEPYPFAEKHIDAFRSICPAAQIRVVDGELFSWYGSRLLQAPDYFRQLRESLLSALK